MIDIKNSFMQCKNEHMIEEKLSVYKRRYDNANDRCTKDVDDDGAGPRKGFEKRLLHWRKTMYKDTEKGFYILTAYDCNSNISIFV